MTRVYRDGIEPLRIELSRRRRNLRRRADDLAKDSADVLPRARLESVLRRLPDEEAELGDLDAIAEADALLDDAERELRALTKEASERRSELRRLAPVRRALRVLSVLALGVVVLGTAGWLRQRSAHEAALQAHAAACRKSTACSEGGLCGAARREPGMLVCAAVSYADCQASRACAHSGECSVREGRCEALADADCASSAVCALGGRCGAVAGACVASDSARCGALPACRQLGHCTAARGRCGAWYAEDCLAVCASEGLCQPAADGYGCLAVSEQECRRSEGCRRGGACELVEGHCVHPDDERCRRTQGCSWWGSCSLRDGRCVAASNVDCAASSLCQREGLCILQGDSCVADAASCLASQACDWDHRCAERDGRCVGDASR